MQIHHLESHPLDRFHSQGVTLVPLCAAQEPSHLHLVQIRAGGAIGEHPATSSQLFVIVSGTARVRTDNKIVEVEGGEAVAWDAGEVHQTLALTDVVGLIFEAQGDISVAV